MELWIWPIVVYILAILLLKFIDYREFKESPEKGNRYKALPLVYKLACPVLVVPVFIAALFLPITTDNSGYGALFLLAFILFVVVEGFCIKWYRKHGLY